MRMLVTMMSIDQATFASWEPRRHSRHCYRYPWQQYVKLGAVLRHFGHTAVALHGCLESEIQVCLLDVLFPQLTTFALLIV